MFTSLNLLDPLKEVISVTGKPVRGAGWYGSTSGLHTVSISVQNFSGRISVQATLATKPTDDDWFSVLPGNALYLQFPRPGYLIVSPSSGETSTYGFNFTANVVWVRASFDRSYFIPVTATPQYISTFGLIDHVLLKYGNALGQYDYRGSWETAPK